MTLPKIRSFTLPVLALSAFLLSACDDADDPFDCLINDRPRIDTTDMKQPVLNQVFDSKLSVYIQNNDDDDDYTYVWTLTGDLPPGITSAPDDRDLNFSGTATSTGSYAYTVNVRVKDGIDNGAYATTLCRDEVERDYTMTVQEEM